MVVCVSMGMYWSIPVIVETRGVGVPGAWVAGRFVSPVKDACTGHQSLTPSIHIGRLTARQTAVLLLQRFPLSVLPSRSHWKQHYTYHLVVLTSWSCKHKWNFSWPMVWMWDGLRYIINSSATCPWPCYSNPTTMRFHSSVSVSSIIIACLSQGQFQLSLIKYALTFIFPNYLPQLLHSLDVAQIYS